MFASIALGLGWPHSAETVRQDIVSYLETHRDEVVDIPLEEDFKCTFLQGAAAAEHSARVNDEYLKRMSKRGEWGDGVMLSSACRVYSRQINVVLAGSNAVVPLGPTSSSGDCHNPISLGYISDIKHYVFLQPKGTVSHSDISKQSTTTISASTTSLNAAEHCASASDTDTVATSPYNAKLSVSEKQQSSWPRTDFSCLKYSSNFSIVTENYDIGSISNRHALCDDTKRLILAGRSKLPSHFQFPQTSGRRYNPSWEKLFSWLRYSVSLDAAYCAPCFIFATYNKNSELIDTPFKDWKNSIGTRRGRLNTHSHSDIHRQSLIAADNFLRVANDDMKPITSSISQAYADRVARNRSIMKSLIEIVLICARQGFSLRGHQWNNIDHSEDGNFAYLVRWAAKTDAVLQSHIDSAVHNAKYLSPTTQNELIACIESEIREQIVTRCNKSPFMSVMADETTDCGGIEQLALCVRYVNEKTKGRFEVCEDFLGFTKLKVANAEHITDKILGKMSEWGVDHTHLRGKGFDGASTMSGHISGVQARISQKLPMAKYFTHCSSHCLNLVVVQCCKVQMVRNFIDSLQRLSVFIRGSAKRKSLHQDIFAKCGDDRESRFPDYEDADIVNHALDVGYGRQVLPSLCETRWLARVDAVSTLLARYSDVYETLTVISESGGPSASDANTFQLSMSSFSWLLTAVVSQYILAFIRPLSLTLQAESCDLMLAFEEAQTLTSVLEKQRSEEVFRLLFHRACSLGIDTFGDTFKAEKPRTCKLSRNRPNAGDTSQSDEEYFRRNLYYPFVDEAVGNLKERFPTGLKDALLGSYLVPHRLEQLGDKELHAVKEEFVNDLPHPESLEQEVRKCGLFNFNTGISQ